MNVKVEALDQHKVSLTIELPAEAVQKGFKQAVARIANQVRIPGFRKGKASRKVLEMHFGKEAVVAEAKDIVINGALSEAMQQEKIIPITQADVKEDLFSETEGAKFTATFVKRPEVELGEYKGLEAAHEEPEISDAQVEAELKKAAEQSARLEMAEEGAVLAKGDYAVIDFKGFVDGKPFEGGEGKTYPLEIGSQSFIPGFEEQLAHRFSHRLSSPALLTSFRSVLASPQRKAHRFGGVFLARLHQRSDLCGEFVEVGAVLVKTGLRRAACLVEFENLVYEFFRIEMFHRKAAHNFLWIFFDCS